MVPVLCYLAAISTLAGAQQPAVQPSAWPEVLTLEDAARLPRVSPTVLGQLTDWRQVRLLGHHQTNGSIAREVRSWR